MGLRQNALILLLLAALLAIIGDWTGGGSLHLWGVPAILLLLGLTYESWMVRRAAISLRLTAPAHWYLGRATPVELRLHHRLPRELLFEVAPGAVAEVSMDRSVRRLYAGGHAGDAGDAAGRRALTATARRLGRYGWPAVQTRVSGVLGLAWWPRAFAVAGEFQVVPDVLREASRSPGLHAYGRQPLERRGAGSDLLQLRDYRPGDPPRSIDWKATARCHRLISRDFVDYQQLDVLIAVDSGRASGLAAGDTDRLALYANVAARLAQRAVDCEDRVGLLIYAGHTLAAAPPGQGTAAVIRVRSLLSQMSVAPVDSNHVLAAIAIRSLLRHRGLVVMLTDLDDATLTGEMRSAVRLLLPKHLPFIAAVASERIAARARGRAADESAAWQALSAQEYVNATERQAASLRVLGAPTVLAPARHLDRAVIDAYSSFRRRRRI